MDMRYGDSIDGLYLKAAVLALHDKRYQYCHDLLHHPSVLANVTHNGYLRNWIMDRLPENIKDRKDRDSGL